MKSKQPLPCTSSTTLPGAGSTAGIAMEGEAVPLVVGVHPRPGARNRRRHGLGLVSVVALTYFNVCGGPWGSEEIMSAAGPAWGLTGLLLAPLVWSIPVALMTSELSSAFPCNGGYSIWVAASLGQYWGFQETYWSWVSGVIDNAVYPVLVYQTIRQGLFPTAHVSAGLSYAVKFVIMVLFAMPNLFCIRRLGQTLAAALVATALPFVALCVAAAPRFDITRLGEASTVGAARWRTFFTILFWNYNGFDCISTSAGEVDEPHRTIPRALLIAVPLVTCTYAVPLVFAVGASKPGAWASWSDGSFASIAVDLGGPGLGAAIVLASTVGAAGLFVAELFEDSFQLQGIAVADPEDSSATCDGGAAVDATQERLLPCPWLGRRHPKLGTPMHAVGVNLLVMSIFIALDFEAIVSLTNFFACLSTLLEFVAFVNLRRTQPELPRPVRIPVQSPLALGLFVAAPCGAAFAVMISACTQSFAALSLNLVALLCGLLLGRRRRKTRTQAASAAAIVVRRRRADEDAGEAAFGGVGATNI